MRAADVRPNTIFFLFAQYGGRSIIPLDEVCRDYFSHLTVQQFLRKVGSGEIRIPVTRMEESQKCHKGVYINDLADYIDAQRKLAVDDFEKLNSK
jgi:hypothetical protein